MISRVSRLRISILLMLGRGKLWNKLCNGGVESEEWAVTGVLMAGVALPVPHLIFTSERLSHA